MKKLLLILCLLPVFGFGQIQVKYAADRFVVNSQITSSTAYQIEVSGGNYFWDVTAFWGKSALSTSYVKMQESVDGVKWVNCLTDSITLASQPGYIVSFQDDRLLVKYLRIYFKVTPGDTINGLNIDYSFKQR